MLARTLFLILTVPLLTVPATLAQDDLTVQSHWKVGIATSGWHRPDPVRELVVESGRYVSREIPGIEWEVADQVIVLPDDLPRYGDPAFANALGAAIDADDLPEGIDILFVYTPFVSRSRSFGYALLRTQPAGLDRPIWFSVVNLRPERVALGRVAREATDKAILEEKNAWRTADALSEVTHLLLGRSRLMRHALILTTVHEFGHFLSPGDPDVKDGIDAGWLKNGAPAHNPDLHGADCIMYNAPSIDSIWTKATESFPDAIRYCDRCKERLGVR